LPLRGDVQSEHCFYRGIEAPSTINSRRFPAAAGIDYQFERGVPALSSILDALKKAEQDAGVDDGKGTPWPAPPTANPADRMFRRRWWIPFGLIAVLCLCLFTAVFWLSRRPEPSQQPVVAKRSVEPAVTEEAKPVAPPNQQTPSTIYRVPTAVPPTAQSAVQPHKRPSPALAPDTALIKVPPQRKQKRTEISEAKPPPVTPPPATAIRRPVKTAETPRPSEPKETDNQKAFRSDARIELQALVWAPDAADRFVVINNRLIKEGGALDNITVVRINQDDVLLSEGTDRWYQEFKIR
jgi:hypothetical protein